MEAILDHSKPDIFSPDHRDQLTRVVVIGGKRRVDLRAVTNGLMYILSTDASGLPFPRTCRRAAR